MRVESSEFKLFDEALELFASIDMRDVLFSEGFRYLCTNDNYGSIDNDRYVFRRRDSYRLLSRDIALKYLVNGDHIDVYYDKERRLNHIYVNGNKVDRSSIEKMTLVDGIISSDVIVSEGGMGVRDSKFAILVLMRLMWGRISHEMMLSKMARHLERQGRYNWESLLSKHKITAIKLGLIDDDYKRYERLVMDKQLPKIVEHYGYQRHFVIGLNDNDIQDIKRKVDLAKLAAELTGNRLRYVEGGGDSFSKTKYHQVDCVINGKATVINVYDFYWYSESQDDNCRNGDAIDMVRHIGPMAGCSFDEALRFLAQMVNFDVGENFYQKRKTLIYTKGDKRLRLFPGLGKDVYMFEYIVSGTGGTGWLDRARGYSVDFVAWEGGKSYRDSVSWVKDFIVKNFTDEQVILFTRLAMGRSGYIRAVEDNDSLLMRLSNRMGYANRVDKLRGHQVMG